MQWIYIAEWARAVKETETNFELAIWITVILVSNETKEKRCKADVARGCNTDVVQAPFRWLVIVKLIAVLFMDLCKTDMKKALYILLSLSIINEKFLPFADDMKAWIW